MFCHNGTLFDADRVPLKKYKPKGLTDSERLFLYILEAVEKSSDPADDIQKRLHGLEKTQSYNSLTCLITDGKTLYAYRDYSDQKLQAGESLEERERYYTLWSFEGKGQTLVCSEPLGNQAGWEKLKNGKFAAFSLKG